MPNDVSLRRYSPEVTAQVCAADGMPLYPTIVGPRCPLCGAATGR